MSYLIGIGIGVVLVELVRFVGRSWSRRVYDAQALARYRSEDEYLQNEENKEVDKDLLDLCDLVESK